MKGDHFHNLCSYLAAAGHCVREPESVKVMACASVKPLARQIRTPTLMFLYIQETSAYYVTSKSNVVHVAITSVQIKLRQDIAYISGLIKVG